MTNPMINPQQNYSGVTIQILNPAVNVDNSPYSPYAAQNSPKSNGNYVSYPQGFDNNFNNNIYNNPYAVKSGITEQNGNNQNQYPNNINHNNENYGNTLGPSYPPEYYLNDYNYRNSAINQEEQQNILNQNKENYSNIYQNEAKDEATTVNKNNTKVQDKLNIAVDDENIKENTNKSSTYVNSNTEEVSNSIIDSKKSTDTETESISDKNTEMVHAQDDIKSKHVVKNYNPSEYRIYSEEGSNTEEDTTTSQGIIGELNQRAAAAEEEKKNSKETRIVALTDEYIKSLENYLNNPNDEIRLMASKEILTRLDEDKDRYDDAALNALLNKMLQDPSKLIRIAALSAFASQLASGNDYTVQLLNNIQANPNADKEDVLQAADILLKMSAGTEIKRIPNPPKSETNQEQKVNN